MPKKDKSIKNIRRFDQIAINVNDRVQPDEVNVDHYVGLEHLDPDSLKIRRWGSPDDVGATKLRFKKGDIIFGRRRVYQRKLAVAEFDGICSAHAMVLRPKTDVVLPEFLPFFMQSDLFMNRALEISVGSLSPTINWKTLAKQEFALPPLEEQRRIAELMIKVTRLEQALEETKRKLEILAISTFEELIGLQFMKSDSEDVGKNSKYFGAVPSDWNEKQLNLLCLVITDGEHSTPKREESGIPLLSARNVFDGYLDLEDVDYISDETFTRLSKRVLPQMGDVLLTCSGTIGRACAVPKNLNFAMVRSVALIRPDPEKLDHQFLELFLWSRYAKRQIDSLTQQTAQGNLFQKAIRKIRLPLFSLEKQAEIVNSIQVQLNAQRKIHYRETEIKNFRKRMLETSLAI